MDKLSGAEYFKNDLWYNAVCVYILLCKKFNKECNNYEEMAKKIKNNFLKSFWNDKEEYFYDIIDDNKEDDTIRPNAVIALSLPFTMVNEHVEKNHKKGI